MLPQATAPLFVLLVHNLGLLFSSLKNNCLVALTFTNSLLEALPASTCHHSQSQCYLFIYFIVIPVPYFLYQICVKYILLWNKLC